MRFFALGPAWLERVAGREAGASKPASRRSASGTSFDRLRTNGVFVRAVPTPPIDLGLPRDGSRTGRLPATFDPPGTNARSGNAAPADAGFSLIEALVALAILAIATVGLIRTVETHIDSTRALESRQVAMWVAENRLAELEAGVDGADRAEMLGRPWRIAVAERATADPAIRRVRIDVYDAGARSDASPLASLDGFVDAGPA